MRFTERMTGERGAVVDLVRHGLRTQADAAARLERIDRLVRRLVRRVARAGGDLQALAYQWQPPAPNRLPDGVRTTVRAIATEHPAWSAQAGWEAVKARRASNFWTRSCSTARFARRAAFSVRSAACCCRSVASSSHSGAGLESRVVLAGSGASGSSVMLMPRL